MPAPVRQLRRNAALAKRSEVLARAQRPGIQLGAHDVAAIVGKRGTGKSTAAKALLARLLEEGARVVAVDPHDEYSREGVQTDHVTLGPLDDRVTMAELREHPEILADPYLSLAVKSSIDPEVLAAEVAELIDLLVAHGPLDSKPEEVGVLLVLEEMALLFGNRDAEKKLNILATQSRHWGMPVLFVAQRLVHVPLTARSQLSILLSFRQDQPADLAALEDLAGRAFVDQVRQLGRGEWRLWRDAIPPSSSGSVPQLEANHSARRSTSK